MNNSTTYLASSRFCDAHDLRVRRLAFELTKGCTSDNEKAVRLFRWVRDQIKYRLGLYPHTASETLQERSGSCSNKANLLVALLRAAGIPAGFHIIHVKTKEYFGPLCSTVFHPFLSDRSLHIFCGIFIDDRWLKCDPSDDAELSESTQHINPQSRKVDFDGHNDALLNLCLEHILSGDGVCNPHIDGVLSKVRKSPPVFLTVLDHYLEFLRKRGRDYSSTEELTGGFLSWLERAFPQGHFLLRQGATSDDLAATA